MNQLLCEINKKLYLNREKIALPLYTLFKRKNFLHISFSSSGCFFRKQGACTMCNYGYGKMLEKDGVEKIFFEIFSKNLDIDELLVGSCGSIFDETEVTWDVFEKIVDCLLTVNVKTIIFETHYSTVTLGKLDYLKKRFSNKNTEIVIEMGLESSNPLILHHCLNKPIIIDQLVETVKLIKSYNMGVVLNVLFGTPFLTLSQQISDCIESIKFAIENNADRVDIFPVNIKRNTLVDYLFQKNEYKRISLWQLIYLIKFVPYDYLNRIEFSWIGERQNEGGANNALPPLYCNKCKNTLFNFFDHFMDTYDNETRHNLIQKFWDINDEKYCDCIINMTEFKFLNTDIPDYCSIQKKVEEIAKEILYEKNS